MARALFVAVGIAAAAGCALFPALDGLAGGGASADGGGEAGGGPLDAAGDAEAADGGGPTGCALYADASFCVDFEGPGALSASVWTRNDDQAGTGKILLTQSAFTSPVNAASINLLDAPDCSYLKLERTFEGDFRNVRARLSIRPETIGPFITFGSSVSPAYVIQVVFDTPTNVHLFVQRDGQTLVIEDRLTFATSRVGTFSTLILEYASAPENAFLVTLEGKKSTLALPAAATPGRGPSLGIGPHCAWSTNRVVVDDVAVWLTP